MTKIVIILNGEEKTIEKGTKINDLIKNLDLDITKIAIERNLEIVQIDDFAKITLEEQDQIEIVHFIGGG